MSYDFCLCTDRSSIFDTRNNDEDDYDLSSRKPSRTRPRRHVRRRIPKRYSDIVGPSNTKLLLSRKESAIREKSQLNRPATNLPRRHSLQPLHEIVPSLNSDPSKPHEIKVNCLNQPAKQRDLLAHRMQAAMSTELMHSLDRNFVFGDRKSKTNHFLMARSHSFNICTSWNEKPELIPHQRLIPRVQTINFERADLPSEEPTPDYDEQNDESTVIRTIPNEDNSDEEPVVDYDDSKSPLEGDFADKSLTSSELAISSSLIIAQTSTTTTDEQTSIPPVPPPLPNLPDDQKKLTFRCRTIADTLSSNHRLILKDEEERSASHLHGPDDQTLPVESSQTAPPPPQPGPHYFHVSKNNRLRQVSRTCSHSSRSSLTQLNDHETEVTTTCAKRCVTDEQIRDSFSSSSPVTSIVPENDYEPHSSSSRIYNDYKKRASLTSIPTNTIGTHSMIIHPMHTRIGLRSSTSSSSTNEKLTDLTLSGKQMNVCVINQLNEHLSTRFPKQQQQSVSNNTDHPTYDPPPEHMTENNIPSNVYDEPNAATTAVNRECPSSIPPPPPPLPVGGFRPIQPSIDRSSQPQRTSRLMLSREEANSTVPGSMGTSTVSSNLSDTRILSELRDNPLFSRAKQHLDIEPGSSGRRSGRRLASSTSNLTNTRTTPTNEIVSYLRLDKCSRTTSSKKPVEPANGKEAVETIILHSSELDALIGKRTKSNNDIRQVQSRSGTKLFGQTQCRQSELELIFQKRAQRSEHNLT